MQRSGFSYHLYVLIGRLGPGMSYLYGVCEHVQYNAPTRKTIYEPLESFQLYD